MSDSPKHLLIVDDEAALRETIAERLSDHGFVVEQAGNGACHTGAHSCFYRRFGTEGSSAT